MDLTKTEYFECCCHSPEHLLHFHLDKEEPATFYVNVHLGPDSFLKRVINAVKYIFGYTSRYGDFDEFLLKQEDCDRFIALLQEYKNCSNALGVKKGDV